MCAEIFLAVNWP